MTRKREIKYEIKRDGSNNWRNGVDSTLAIGNTDSNFAPPFSSSRLHLISEGKNSGLSVVGWTEHLDPHHAGRLASLPGKVTAAD
jgi:hypothetical protein